MWYYMNMQRVPFIEYNYIGEVAGLLMAVILLFCMLYVKPKKTYIYRYIFNGTILSILGTLVQISIVIVANNPEDYYNNNLFIIQLLAFLLIYNGILFCIFSYVNMMSIVRRSQKKEFMFMYAFYTTIYVLGIIIEIASSGLYTLMYGGIDIKHFTRFYTGAGVVCAIVCFASSIINRKHISRITWHAVCIFAPIDVGILILQMICVERIHSIFSAITYLPIFMLGYLMFHSVPFDEISGSQNEHALEAYLERNLGKKRLYIAYVVLKTPNVESFTSVDYDSYYYGIKVCRNIDSISPKLRMYLVNGCEFVDVLQEEDKEKAMDSLEKIRGIMDKARVDIDAPFNYTIIAGEVKGELDSSLKIKQFFEFVSRKYINQNSSKFYYAKSSDYDDFANYYEISNILKDIRLHEDLEDERIIVYAQPIYSVESGSFRSAEALMRLKLGDRLVSPDLFIPIAEDGGTIHMLTCIILNKVCRAISQFSEYYEFDSISINCSSKELSMETLNTDFLEIINRYDIDPSLIRLEVTETAMFDNYEMVNRNMDILSREGIQFYLDDFGTGYSSLERIMNCPFNTIKFDKTLLYKSLDDERMNDIMSYMIEVFKKNGFITLIEGVEDESQYQYSVDHGFDFIQGYLYAKPTPIEEIKKYFTRKSGF